MERTSNRSLGRRIKVTFSIIIFIMSISFIYSNIMKSKIISEYNTFMKINIQLSDLSLELNNSWVYFDSYMKSKDEEVYEKIIETNEKVDEIIHEVTNYVKLDKDSGIYLRNLISMFEWFKEQTNLVMEKEESNQETYEQYLKIRTMNYYISQHSRNLTSSFLQYTDSYYSETLDEYKILDTNVYFLLILTIFINVFLLKIVNDDIINTINRLSISVKQLSDANWDIPDIEGDSYKELDNLTNTFNHMKNSIRAYIRELNEKSEIERNYQQEKIKNIEKDKIIRETQLSILQMQINPHFLFNNLNTVGRMAMFENAEKTVELIESVSKILRYNLLNKDNLIKLRDEIENVKAYIYIQKIKYENRVTFSFDIEDELYNIYLPPMIIQLLVENAINHGFSGTKKKGNIDINAKKNNDYMIVTIEDNGNGINSEELDKLIKGEEIIRKNKRSTGLGIKNIVSRLELYYNRNDLFNIESVEGQGTKVSILIPIEESERIAENSYS